MPPIYGLGLGDSDCYHNGRHGNDTRVALAVAERRLGGGRMVVEVAIGIEMK